MQSVVEDEEGTPGQRPTNVERWFMSKKRSKAKAQALKAHITFFEVGAEGTLRMVDH